MSKEQFKNKEHVNWRDVDTIKGKIEKTREKVSAKKGILANIEQQLTKLEIISSFVKEAKSIQIKFINEYDFEKLLSEKDITKQIENEYTADSIEYIVLFNSQTGDFKQNKLESEVEKIISWFLELFDHSRKTYEIFHENNQIKCEYILENQYIKYLTSNIILFIDDISFFEESSKKIISALLDYCLKNNIELSKSEKNTLKIKIEGLIELPSSEEEIFEYLPYFETDDNQNTVLGEIDEE